MQVHPFQSPRVIIYIESLWWAQCSSAKRSGGAEINDSREPEFLRAANGGDGKEGCSEPKEGWAALLGLGEASPAEGGASWHICRVFLSSKHKKALEIIISLTIPVGARRSLPSYHHYRQSLMWFDISNNTNKVRFLLMQYPWISMNQCDHWSSIHRALF